MIRHIINLEMPDDSKLPRPGLWVHSLESWPDRYFQQVRESARRWNEDGASFIFTNKTLIEFSPIQICTLHIIAPFHLSLWGKSQMMTEIVQRLEDDFHLRLFDDAVDKEKLANSIGILAFSYEGGKFNKWSEGEKFNQRHQILKPGILASTW